MRRRIIRSCCLVLSLVAFEVSANCVQKDFAEFKRTMMPQVGKTTTVEGVLHGAKLGYIVEFGGWGIYLYGDVAKMNRLSPLLEQTVKVTGTLRYAPPPNVPTGPVAYAVVPEHFFFDITEAKVVSTQKRAFIPELNRKPLVVAAAPEECLRTFREFFRYVQRTEPSIVKDETAQGRWLSKNLREALKQKVATFNDQPNDPDFPGNGTFVGTWDSPSTFTILGSRRYDKRAVIDVWYSWGKGTNYPGDTRLSYFVFVLEEGRWKLDDVYTFRGEFASAESLNAYLRSK